VTRRSLGEFEQQVLLTMLRMGGEAYSVPMVLEMEERSGREVSQAAVYIALRRLEDKGLVSSRMEEPEATDSGRERRYFRVEPAGVEQLRESRRTMERFWEGLEDVVEER
jgi:PadR family transcriptional regulator PadR